MAPDQRARILAHALGLMAQRGADGVSMRDLANACELNVATLYHYFPSKADLLRSVIEDRDWPSRMIEPLPVDPTLPPRQRLAQLLTLIWTEALREEDVWRLVLGESLRSDDVARRVAAEMVQGLEAALDRWLGDLFPDLGARTAAVAGVITGRSLGMFVEYLVMDPADRVRGARARAEQLAAVVFP
jgi:TetR/AcrR family transcriptional repressor of nem operon